VVPSLVWPPLAGGSVLRAVVVFRTALAESTYEVWLDRNGWHNKLSTVPCADIDGKRAEEKDDV
jgi:hypothetical protein